MPTKVTGLSRFALLAAWLVAFCVPAAAPVRGGQNSTDPVDTVALGLLKQAAQNYKNLKSYEAHVTVDTVENAKTSDRHFIEIGSGASFRIEDENPRGLLCVSDGQTEWTLDRAANQYVKGPADAAQPSFVNELASVGQNVIAADLLREDLFTENGKTKKVFILEVQRSHWPAGEPADAQMATVRIDENTFEIYGMNIYTNGPTRILRYAFDQENQKVAASTFAFAAPAAATEVRSIKASGTAASSVIGTEAPDFTLADASGHSYHLRDLRGKVVVVDFWASWCGPCRESMPFLQAIQDQYGARGVVVLGLDGGEDAETVADFAKATKYTFPLLIGGEPTVSSQYFVDAYPTALVVDRDGKIVLREAGFDGPRPLILAVQNALAEKN
jgi:thiol-disulfide isomerase/thioredoxin